MVSNEMMVVMVDVVLGSGRWDCRFRGCSSVRDSAPDAKASASRQRTSAGRASIARIVGLSRRSEIVGRGVAAGHSLDHLYGSGDGLGIGLWPAKTAGEPLKELLDLLAANGAFSNVVFFIFFVFIGRNRMVGHGSLVSVIVGEFEC